MKNLSLESIINDLEEINSIMANQNKLLEEHIVKEDDEEDYLKNALVERNKMINSKIEVMIEKLKILKG